MNIAQILRLSMLPIKDIDLALPNKGLIYEIGSGVGIIASEIAKANSQRQVVGVEKSLKKINLARSHFNFKNLDFVEADATAFPYEACDGVTMSDFLHHLDYESQEKVIRLATRKLRSHGVLVIKEIAKDDGIFMILSRIFDFLFYPKDKIHYRSRAEWNKLLVGKGYQVLTKRAVHWFPGSTHLFICTKK